MVGRVRQGWWWGEGREEGYREGQGQRVRPMQDKVVGRGDRAELGLGRAGQGRWHCKRVGQGTRKGVGRPLHKLSQARG